MALYNWSLKNLWFKTLWIFLCFWIFWKVGIKNFKLWKSI